MESISKAQGLERVLREAATPHVAACGLVTLGRQAVGLAILRTSGEKQPLTPAWWVISLATRSDTLSSASRSTTSSSLDRAPFFETERSTLVIDVFSHT